MICLHIGYVRIWALLHKQITLLKGIKHVEKKNKKKTKKQKTLILITYVRFSYGWLDLSLKAKSTLLMSCRDDQFT